MVKFSYYGMREAPYRYIREGSIARKRPHDRPSALRREHIMTAQASPAP